MIVLVWAGAALAILGLCGLIWCIRTARDIRRDAPPEEEAKSRLRLLIAVNMGSVCLAFLGLGALAVGLIL